MLDYDVRPINATISPKKTDKKVYNKWMGIVLTVIPPIHKYECPYCHKRQDKETEYCPNCGEKLIVEY